MFFPNSRTGGEDKFHVNCGTRSLVLSGLVNIEFVDTTSGREGDHRSLITVKVRNGNV